MSTGQLLRAELTSAYSAGQLLRAELTSPAIEVSAGQLLRAELSTPPYTTISLGPNRVADGLELVTFDATWTGAPPTGWTWTIQSDPSGEATLQPDGAQCVLVAPATLEGVTVVVGATATNGTTTSPLASVSVSVYPHLDWVRVAGAWVPFYEDII